MRPVHRGPTPAGSALAIVAEGFLSRLSFGLIGLALPLYALRLGMTLSQVGVLVSANVVLMLVAKPVLSPLADRFGHRRMLIVAIAGRSLVGLLLAVAVAPWQLFAIRLLYGLTQALRDPPLNALIADAGGAKRVASVFGWYHTAKNVAASLGRAAAGVLLAVGPSQDYRRVFVVAFVLSLLPLGVVARFLRPGSGRPDAGPESDPPADSPADSAPDPRDRVWTLTVLGFLFGTTAGMMNLFPAIATVYFHLDPAQIGFIMLGSAVVVIVAGPVFGWLADHRSRALVLSVRGFANIVSSLMYLALPSVWGVGASKVVDDTGKAAFRPAWGSVMAEAARRHPGRRARVLSVIDVGEDAGDAAGPILAGGLLALGGLPLMLGTRCGVAAVTEVWTWWVTHRQRPAPVRAAAAGSADAVRPASRAGPADGA
ncbi:MAG TPA: MFS transporter [Intrasporangium sp.]|uniref:MFS transporter n=1 Tax=Intrasporangium sp. TaxID=1925024 RepID=UPI002D775BE7|nr:MFS transporter [Intrasporangium sp.]HET7397875.1 MFS transporter [Intrasporangium sp.]